MEPLLAEREQNEEEVRELLELGEKLEGLTRNVGMHAGGVLIAPGKLTDFCPLYAAEGTAQRHLAVRQGRRRGGRPGQVRLPRPHHADHPRLGGALRRAARARRSFALEKLPLDDTATYKLLSAGNTTAVFQFESRGMRDLLKRARPDRFEDIIALVALYRPGPDGPDPRVHRAQARQQRVEYLDPRLEPILGPTYGIMVYQEQVMQIAQVIGGYTLGGADLLRRAMGKKKPEEMAQQRDIFVAGAEKNGLPKAKATQLFDLMEKFAGYGFNKSHAAAYALVAYQTAYMKAHHAAAFMAANLSVVMDDTDKVRQFHDDAVANGLDGAAARHQRVGLPLRAGRREHRPLRPGRRARHRRVGDRAHRRRAQARRRSRTCSTSAARVDKRLVNRRVVEALVRAGAFDAIDANRARLLASAGTRPRGGRAGRARRPRRTSLFGEAEAPRGGAHATSTRRRGTRGRSCWRRRPRSASTSRATCSRSTRASSATFRARRSPG